MNKKETIEAYLEVHPNATETEIFENLQGGKLTFTKPYVRKVASIWRNHRNDPPEPKPIDIPGNELSLEMIESYIFQCIKHPEFEYNTSLINTAIKMLELKNKIEPEQLKKLRETERVEFTETIEDAIDYINTIKPNYELEIPAQPRSDDKASQTEG